MKHRNYYTTLNKKRIAFFALICVVLAAVVYHVHLANITAAAEDATVRAYIMCKPGTTVNVRRTPDKQYQDVGFLECGDWFETDATSSKGFFRCYGVGDYGEGWVFNGYVATEEPEIVNEQYVVVANKRVACRRWINGPQISERPWITNGTNVWVYCIADGWAVTSHGYVQAEWLEVDPAW